MCGFRLSLEGCIVKAVDYCNNGATFYYSKIDSAGSNYIVLSNPSSRPKRIGIENILSPTNLLGFYNEWLVACATVSTNAIKGTVQNFDELLLVENPTLYDFYVVEEEQGTRWLPGSLGGTFYDKGIYYWNGTTWVFDNASLYKGLEDLIQAFNGHTHIKADIIDFNDSDYATAAQGLLADSAVQPSDLATVAFSGDYNDLTNLPTNNTVMDYRSSFEIVDGYVYSGYLLNGSPVVKRCNDLGNEFGQGVTNLNTDWTNRLLLTYI